MFCFVCGAFQGEEVSQRRLAMSGDETGGAGDAHEGRHLRLWLG